jgi:hypothetical protein
MSQKQHFHNPPLFVQLVLKRNSYEKINDQKSSVT